MTHLGWVWRSLFWALAVLLVAYLMFVVLSGRGQTPANIASLLSILLASVALWFYFRPLAICTVEMYEVVPGEGRPRTFRLVVRNTGNVPLRITRFEAEFQGGVPRPSRIDYARLFLREGKPLAPSAEIPVWLTASEMDGRTGFVVTYRGWFPSEYQARCDVGPFGVTFHETMTATAMGKASVTAKVVRASEAKPEGEQGGSEPPTE